MLLFFGLCYTDSVVSKKKHDKIQCFQLIVRPLFKYLANGDIFSCKSGTIDGGMLKICMDIYRWLVCVYHHY